LTAQLQYLTVDSASPPLRPHLTALMPLYHHPVVQTGSLCSMRSHTGTAMPHCAMNVHPGVMLHLQEATGQVPQPPGAPMLGLHQPSPSALQELPGSSHSSSVAT